MQIAAQLRQQHAELERAQMELQRSKQQAIQSDKEKEERANQQRVRCGHISFE